MFNTELYYLLIGEYELICMNGKAINQLLLYEMGKRAIFYGSNAEHDLNLDKYG